MVPRCKTIFHQMSDQNGHQMWYQKGTELVTDQIGYKMIKLVTKWDQIGH